MKLTWLTHLQQIQSILFTFEYISRPLHDKLDQCFQEVFKSAEDQLFLSLDSNEKATSLWESYLEKVILVLEEVGRPFHEKEDSQLNQEELSLKYSTQKATILLTAISGQHPPVPLPTVSFVSSLMGEVAKYPKSIQTVGDLFIWIWAFTSTTV